MKRIIVLLTVVALMVVMLAMTVAPASALNGQSFNACLAMYVRTVHPQVPFCDIK